MAKDEIAKQQANLKAEWAHLSKAQSQLKKDEAVVIVGKRDLDKELERMKGKWADLSAAQDKLKADRDQLEKAQKDLAESTAAVDEEKADMGVRQAAMATIATIVDPKAKIPLNAVERGELETLEARAGNGQDLPAPPDMLILARLRIRATLG